MNKTIIREGNTKEEMFQLLEEMDDLTNIDSLVKTGEKVLVECSRENGKLSHWSVCAEKPKKKFKPFAVGNNLKSFEKKLDSLTDTAKIFERPDCVVLCLISTEPTKKWDEKIISHWVEINPGQPYVLKNGKLDFETKKLEFTNEEYYFMAQTGLAFHCKTTGIFYPVTPMAYASLGRIFDCTAAFNQIDKHLLGSALLLAEKMSYATQLRIIHRSRKSKVRPVLSVAGSRYQLFPQSRFFRLALSVGASQLGVYSVKQWRITESFSTLVLAFCNEWEDYEFELHIQTGDIPQYSFKTILYANFGEKKLKLAEVSKPHDLSFKEEDIPTLFEEFKEEMQRFRDTYDLLEVSECTFEGKMLLKIHKCIGKKRTESLKKIQPGVYQSLDLFKMILNTRYVELSETQKNRLDKFFLELFYNIADISKQKKFA